LRDVMSADLARRSDLPNLVRRRAAHVVGENERVWRAVKLLEAGDGVGLGKLMSESHESSRQNFENSTPELDLLVSIAQELPAVPISGDQKWSPYHCLAPILQSMRAGFFGTMYATINPAAGFNTMPDHLAITMRTGRRQHMNRTLEAVKSSSLSG